MDTLRDILLGGALVVLVVALRLLGVKEADE